MTVFADEARVVVILHVGSHGHLGSRIGFSDRGLRRQLINHRERARHGAEAKKPRPGAKHSAFASAFASLLLQPCTRPTSFALRTSMSPTRSPSSPVPAPASAASTRPELALENAGATPAAPAGAAGAAPAADPAGAAAAAPAAHGRGSRGRRLRLEIGDGSSSFDPTLEQAPAEAQGDC